MMDGLSWSLVLAAAGLGLSHTLLGPDHYLPFIMLGRARGWSVRRTALMTAACGAGHVAASVVLGLVGIGLGLALSRIQQVEEGRGNLAAWAIVAFGVAYGAWGARHALRRSGGIEAHAHGRYVHVHHHGDRPHEHGAPRADGSTDGTFWALFVVFVLGPCEPLIPLMVMPGSRGRWGLATLAVAVFGVTTIATMVAATVAGYWGLRQVDLGPLARWSHALAGGIIAASGLAVLFLGL
jgi:hypothetical protein